MGYYIAESIFVNGFEGHMQKAVVVSGYADFIRFIVLTNTVNDFWSQWCETWEDHNVGLDLVHI